MIGVGTIGTDIGEQPAALCRTLVVSERCRVMAGLLLLLTVRVAYLLACPLELIPDEAYYWDWSRQLDWSYFSKPPLIAWLIALATTIGGDSEFAIRLPATLLGTAGLGVVYELGRRMYGHATGVWSLLVVAASPGMTALCLLMTIDAPFLLAWTASVYCLWRMFEADDINARWLAASGTDFSQVTRSVSEGNSGKCHFHSPSLTHRVSKVSAIWLAAAIIATGAGLLAKQSALGLFPLAGLFLATGRADRRQLKRPSFWLWVFGSAACLLPVMWWNHTHGWITVGHTRGHFDPQSASSLRHLKLFGEFMAGQFGILSPLVCLLLLVVTAVVLSKYTRMPRRERFLLCFGGVPLLAVAALSCCQRVQPNWPAALHLTGVILVAAWSCGEVSLSARLDAYRHWLTPAVALGAVLSVAVALVPFIVPSSPLAGTKLDPTGRLRGWREMADQVAILRNSMPRSQDMLVVAATSRGPVSELAYYLPGRPRVYRWNVGEIIDSQHDVWGGPQDGAGRDALIVTDDVAPVPLRLAGAFTTVEEVGSVVVPVGPDKTRRYRVWRGASLRAWPERYEPTRAIAIHPHSLSPSRSVCEEMSRDREGAVVSHCHASLPHGRGSKTSQPRSVP